MLLGIILTILTIIFGVKNYSEKSKEKLGVKTKKIFHFYSIGLISGFILILIGFFTVIYESGMVGGVCINVIIMGLTMITVGFILIAGLLILLALKSNKIKKTTAILCSFFTIILIITINFFVIIDASQSDYYYLDHPVIKLIEESSNNSENLIIWKIYAMSNKRLSIDDFSWYIVDKNSSDYNITFNDNDNDGTLSIGDTFDVTVYSGGYHEFRIVHRPSHRISCSIEANYSTK